MRHQRDCRVSLFGYFKKIVDGSLSGTVCIQSCLETRSELDQRTLSCTW